ncbi:hypothetical protein BU23DRAFT_135279 [Bimuria novae-zelandiae CBS 107.79]|uniref:Secreted protein n=1 Tax=Bimuria novae-zelandiae CBS 107.79 TaxID=1447943 RepID=A0A6A5V9H8_9PLEO|nr:hypothetical protein BU23DRAFT_135279 [Bimuria novae-zelandiae CBS 107.79]
MRKLVTLHKLLYVTALATWLSSEAISNSNPAFWSSACGIPCERMRRSSLRAIGVSCVLCSPHGRYPQEQFDPHSCLLSKFDLILITPKTRANLSSDSKDA